MSATGRRTRAIAWLVAIACAGSASAAPVRIFRTQSPDAWLRGEPDGVAVERGGVLTLAPGAERVASLEAPFAFAAAPFADGWAVATGNDGQLVAAHRRPHVRLCGVYRGGAGVHSLSLV